MDVSSRGSVRLLSLLWFAGTCAAPFASAEPPADLAAAYAAIESKDYELARRELEPLAEAGNQNAQYNLGVLYQRGLGIPKSRKDATLWYRKAAAQGNQHASFALAVMYGSAKGRRFDPVEAYVWFWIAAQQGHPDGRTNMYRVSRAMSLDQISEARKLSEQRLAEFAERDPTPPDAGSTGLAE